MTSSSSQLPVRYVTRAKGSLKFQARAWCLHSIGSLLPNNTGMIDLKSQALSLYRSQRYQSESGVTDHDAEEVPNFLRGHIGKWVELDKRSRAAFHTFKDRVYLSNWNLCPSSWALIFPLPSDPSLQSLQLTPQRSHLRSKATFNSPKHMPFVQNGVLLSWVLQNSGGDENLDQYIGKSGPATSWRPLYQEASAVIYDRTTWQWWWAARLKKIA